MPTLKQMVVTIKIEFLKPVAFKFTNETYYLDKSGNLFGEFVPGAKDDLVEKCTSGRKFKSKEAAIEYLREVLVPFKVIE